MKKTVIVAFFILVSSHLIAQTTSLEPSQDSTVRERFIVNLLKEHYKIGRWIFVTIQDSCNSRTIARLISVSELFKVYEHDHEYNIERTFVFNASINILQQNLFSNCGHSDNPIKGIDVDTEMIKKLNKLTTDELLKTFFDNNQHLKGEKNNFLNEIIAACFLRNIKVITDDPNSIRYEIFK